jgi:hypothetical protein
MTDNESSAGWVVQVTAPNGGEPPVFAFYNVAVRDYDKAVELVRTRLGVPIARVSIVRPLTAGELATAKVRNGEMKPA